MQPARPPDRLMPTTLRRLGLFFFLALPGCLAAAEVDPSLRDAAAAEARFDSKSALDLYLKADAAHPNDPVILQKIARQYSDLTFDLTDPVEQRHLCEKSLAYAQR